MAENRLDRQFNPEKKNQVWASDVTYVWTCEGWLYLAIGLRQPDKGLIHHSDRGSQYASKEYQKRLTRNNMVCSMSRKGNCWDSPVERFFSSLKREWIGDTLYRTRQQAMADIREYVAIYYNAKRLHSTLGYQTPVNFEKTLNRVSGSV